MSSISEMERHGQDHIGHPNAMICPHCGLPFAREQNCIRSFGCGSSFAEAFKPQWSRSMTCLELQNGQLQDRIKRLEEALDCVVVSCSYLHHRKKHQHEYGQPCPVEDLIRKAKEAKP